MKIRKKTPWELKEQNKTIINMIDSWLISLQDRSKKEIFDNLSKKSLNDQTYIDILRKVKTINHITQQRYKEWTLTIRILDFSWKAINKSLWEKRANTQIWIVQFWEYSEYIHNHKSLVNKKINNLIIEIKEDNSSRELKIPQNIKSKLIKYLQDWPSDNPFDCWSFAHFINGINYNRPNLKIKDRTVKDFDQDIKPWETITISDWYNQDTWKYENITHFAIYIWEWLYISKFWNLWWIIIANVDEMKKLFWGSKIHKVFPNHSKEQK